VKKGWIGKLTGTFIALSVVMTTVATLMVVNEAKKEGVEYARDRTKFDCLNEVTIGGHVCTEVSCFIENRNFYQSCMEHASESIELCDSLPEIRALLKLELWKKKQCKNLGRKDRTCHHIWLKALEACGK
jgi:hypothetical protein